MRLKFIMLPLTAMVFLIQAPAIRADIVNGDFSDGLNGWTPLHCSDYSTCTDPDSGIQFITANKEAILSTADLTEPNVIATLFQEIEVPALAQTLSFRVWFEIAKDSTEDPENGGEITVADFLWVSFFDNDSEEYDRSFLGYDSSGAYVLDALGERLSLDNLTGNWFYFQTPVSDLAGRFGTLYFDLEDQNDGYDAIVKLDDISFHVIPEPSTLLLLGSGIWGILGYARKQRKGSKNS